MSLFVCDNCGYVENSNLVAVGLGKDNEYPNMTLNDMCGEGTEEVSITKLDNISGDIKEPEMVLMLCCECNTGTHHDEFTKEYADEAILEIASNSKYNYITPNDALDGCLIKDDDSNWGYIIDPVYKRIKGNMLLNIDDALLVLLMKIESCYLRSEIVMIILNIIHYIWYGVKM